MKKLKMEIDHLKFKPEDISDNLLSELLDLLNVNFFAIDRNGNYIAKNSTLSKIVGDIERGDIINEKAWVSCKRVMETRQREVIEEEHQNHWYLSIKFPLIKQNEVIGVMGFSVDITKQKQAEIAKTEFITNMSHDLRTPFSGILSLSQYLLETETDPAKKELQNDIVLSAKRLLAVMNQVIEVAVLGQNPVKFTEFDIQKVIDEVANLYKAEIRAKNLQLTVNCQHYKICSDQSRIQNILINLLCNAIKFTERGKISIDVFIKPEKIEIEISDTGIGLAEEEFENIFNKFYRAKSSYKEGEFNGAGIGLYVAKQAADDIGAKITVQSKIDIGSTFTVILPSNLR